MIKGKSTPQFGWFRDNSKTKLQRNAQIIINLAVSGIIIRQ